MKQNTSLHPRYRLRLAGWAGLLLAVSAGVLTPGRAGAVTATGGDATNNIPGYSIHMYTNTGSRTFNVSVGGEVEVLVVAGGGGGGGRIGGGGGAGGYVYSNAFSAVAGSNYTVTIGGGGAGGTANNIQGINGGDSVFGSITAVGGGGGGTYNGTKTGLPGGSGGGGSASPSSLGGTGTAFQGTNGGAGSGADAESGGGGGANGAGTNGVVGTGSGAGGPGKSCGITGTTVWYAGGGGGGSWNGIRGTNGVGGGGMGGNSSLNGTNGLPNTGGGGGGAGNIAGAGCAGNGGSGIVIVRYALPPAKLAFTTQPGVGVAGGVWSQQPVVAVQDASGIRVTTDASTVTLAIQNNAGPGGTLGGTLTKQAVNGIADFSGNALSIDLVGNGYTLVATDGTLTSAISSPFNITAAAGPPAKLAFTVVPSSGTAGTAFSVTVQSQDSAGVPSPVTSDTTITLGQASGGGTLSGTLTGVIGNGTHSVTITTPIYSTSDTMTLTATPTMGMTLLTPVTSGNIVFSAGAAAKLAITTQPGGGMAGDALSTQPAVTLQDAYGNTVMGTAQNVTLAILNNAGPGGVLSGTKTVAVNTGTGVATFSGLNIDKVGAGYTLTATGSTVSTTPGVVLSAAFDVTVNLTAYVFHGGAYDGWDACGTAGGAGLKWTVTTIMLL